MEGPDGRVGLEVGLEVVLKVGPGWWWWVGSGNVLAWYPCLSYFLASSVLKKSASQGAILQYHTLFNK